VAELADLRIGGPVGRRTLLVRVPGAEHAAGLETDELIGVLLDGEPDVSVPIGHAELVGQALVLTGSTSRFDAQAIWRRAEDGPFHDVELTVTYRGPMPARAALRMGFDVVSPGTPRWLIPGCFYGENRLEANPRRFPRWDPAGGDPSDLVSDRWSFRSDRTALAMVAVTADEAFGALATAERTASGLTGLGFAGGGERPRIWIDLPYREEPVTFTGPERAGRPDRTWYTWRPGSQLRMATSVVVAVPSRHAYAPFLRVQAARRRQASRLNPWVPANEAAALAAEGLHRWHYQPDDGTLMEAIAFDREPPETHALDRRTMHVAWLSGAPYAAALLHYGRERAHLPYVDAGTRVIDTVAGGLAPCGAFWGEWRNGAWSGGLNPEPDWLHARTIAEATLAVLRAVRAESTHGTSHPAWEAAARSNLAFVVARQRDDGNLGTYYRAEGGEVTGWDGAAGMLWIAAMAEAAVPLGDRSLLDAARTAGAYYARFVEDAFIYGGPEDAHLTPTSEDGYNAVIAYVALHEATGEPEWLYLARQAADWMLTFRLAYNVDFPAETLLGAYDYRTRGADIASPSNQQLHAFGLVCLPEMLRLWRHTGDREFLVRTQDNLAAALQFIARHDGDFNAYRGMVSARYCQTDWAQAKGMMRPLSQASSVGLVLAAAHHAMEDPDALPD
jgi:hypothetical protein